VKRLEFYDRHARLRPIPFLIIGTLACVLALSSGVSFANPSAKVYGYTAGLVVIDVGMVFIAALFVTAGRPLWREDRDPTYLALALAFSGIPVWGLLEVVCLHGMLLALIPGVCDVRPSAGWLVALWFVSLPGVSILLEFRKFLMRGSSESVRA
jgi:hypothetical protein